MNETNDAPPVPADLMPLPEAARLIGSTREVLLGLIERGTLTGYKVGHRWKVRRADAVALVKKTN